MKMNTLAALVLSFVVAGAISSSAQPRVEFKDNRLKVDGNPFFIYGCWGTPNKDYAEFKRRHFNTAFLGWKATVEEGPKAAAAGLMVIPYPYAPGWSDNVEAVMKSVADKDWVLAWDIGDDLSKEEHIQAALKVNEKMKAIDPQKRPVMFDAINRYEEFSKIPDMWCAYAYPLVKDIAPAPPARKPGGLKEYGDWLDRMRLLGRRDGFFWTWTQCHVQVWYCEKYLGGTPKDKWKHSRFPDGDHLRLIAAHAISSGCRGVMWFVARYFQDEFYGRDRYARAAVIGCELGMVGRLIASGRTGPRLKTSDPSVWATPIDFPGGRLICLLKTGDRCHYQPDAAEAKDVRVETGVPGKVHQIGFDVKPLSEPTCSFPLTSWLLVSDDGSLVNRVRAAHAAVLPDMAGFAVEELEARIAKAKPVFETMAKGSEALRPAEERLAEAREHLQAKRWTEAGVAADEGLTLARTAQHRLWRDTLSDDMLAAGFKLTDFYILPDVAGNIALLKRDSWSPNQLKNGSFESDDGWGGGKLGHDATGKVAVLDGVGRNGSRALRLASSSPTIYEGKPQDWVTASVVSGKIPAEKGQVWEVAAWVRVPKDFEQTVRGVTIALFAYGTDGRRVTGYGAQNLETPHVKATNGWQRVRLLVPLRSSDIRSVAARISVCGVGEVFVDDVVVRRLQAR